MQWLPLKRIDRSAIYRLFGTLYLYDNKIKLLKFFSLFTKYHNQIEIRH